MTNLGVFKLSPSSFNGFTITKSDRIRSADNYYNSHNGRLTSLNHALIIIDSVVFYKNYITFSYNK